ncbi:MAG: cytochrome P450 [Zetaproteobacteria bacterium]|nr:cytochrome P450 [Pseudobdellovibrionaceae bacterium]
MTKLPLGTTSAALTSMRVLVDPVGAMEKWKAKYGDPFLCQTLNGPIVMTGDPKGVEQIFKENPLELKPFAVENAGAYLGQGSILLNYGEKHRKDRKLMIPPFAGNRMKAYAEPMARITRQALSEVPAGKEINMLDLGHKISLWVILETVFGFHKRESVQHMDYLVRGMLDNLHPSFMFATALQNKFWPPWRRFSNFKQEYYSQIIKKIEALRSENNMGEDILSLLVAASYDDGSKMSYEELTDQLNTLLIAGHETTAIALAWAMYWILLEPDVFAKVKAEIAELGPEPDPFAYTKLDYLSAVVRETLRIRPIITEMMRFLTKPMDLMGYEVPAGHNVGFSISLLHFNSDVYSEPEKFKPERFLDTKYKPYEFIAFGGGHRRCIGSAFAEFELKLALGIILSSAEWELLDPPDLPMVRRSITMAPKGGVRLVKK